MRLQLRFSSIFLFFIASAFAQEMDNSLISELKRNQIHLESQKIDNDAMKNKYSWISPLNGNFQKQWSKQFNSSASGDKFSISIDQDIFKSGGIYFKIKHAAAYKNLSMLSLKEKEHALITNVVFLLYKIHKAEYEVKKQKSLLANAKIDVQRKSESYLSGDLDSGFLDNAILIKNRQALLLVEYIKRSKILNLELKNISDIDAKTIILPKFSLVSEDIYLGNNFDIRKKDEAINVNYYNKQLISSSRLPTVSLSGSYNYSELDFLPIEMQGEKLYHQYALKANIPLYNFNTQRSLESAQIDYLRTQSEALDIKRLSKNQFAIIQENMKAIEQKVFFINESKELYEKLLTDTKELFIAGEKTEYDVQTLQNSVDIKRYELEVLELDKQSELLSLYKKMDKLILATQK